jgi:hypothetical protein
MIARLYQYRERGIIGGLYPLKQPEIQWCFNTLDGQNMVIEPETELAEMKCVGTGVMLIPREIIEAQIKAHPELAYTDDASGETYYDLWSFGVCEVAAGKRRRLTEDWWFCHRARALGYRVWVDTSCHFKHHGAASYPLQPSLDLLEAQKRIAELEEQLAEVLRRVAK